MKDYSLKEIAQELHVSRGTLDRVIHNRGGISPETTVRVQEFLNRINYRPNKIGRSLARRKLVSLYVSFHDTKGEFFTWNGPKRPDDFFQLRSSVGIDQNRDEH